MRGPIVTTRGAATSTAVARRAGVSRSTVSQVLNGRADLFAPQTVARVLAAAQELDYRPSVAGRALAKGRSDIVVLALPHVTFGARLQDTIDVLSDTLGPAGYDVLVHFSGPSPAATDRLMQRLVPVAIADLGALDARQRDLMRSQGTLVLHGDAGVNESAGEMQAGYLADRGRARLDYALIDDPRRDLYGPEHLVGFARECARRRLPEPRSLHVPLDRPRAVEALARHLAGGPCDAFGCYNDEVAATLVAAARDLGLRVPDDLAVIGIDDSLVGQLAEPAVTTLRPDMRAAGVAIAEQFFAALERAEGAGGEPVPPLDARTVFHAVVERGSA